MALPPAQYRTFRDLTRIMLSVEGVPAADGDVLAFFKQLMTDSVGATALSATRNFLCGEIFRRILSGNSSAPTDADVVSFWTQLATDSNAAAAMGATTNYRAMRNAMRAAISCDALAPTDTDVLGYFSPYAFSPSQIANLTLWLNRSAAKYTDVGGTTPAVGNTARVARVDQPSPLTGSWLQATAARQPFVGAGGALDFESVIVNANGLLLNSPVGQSVTSSSCTLAVSFESYNPPAMGVYGPLMIGTDGNAWGLWLFGGGMRFSYNAGAATWTAGGTFPFRSRIVAVARVTTTGITIDYSVEGVTQTQLTLTAAINTAAVTTFTQSIFAAGSFHGKISDACAYARVLNNTETATLLSGLYGSSAPAGYPTDCPLLGVIGDSISIGQGTNAVAGGPVNQAMPTIWGTAPVKVCSGGVGGQTIAGGVTTLSTVVGPQYSATRAKNIMLLQIGTNSLAQSVTTPAATLTAYLALADAAKAQGWSVILCTLLPRSDAGIVNVNWVADRITYNTSVRAAAASYAGLCDFAAVTGMGATGDELNASNYADLLHPTAAGNILLAPTLSAAVVALL